MREFLIEHTYDLLSAIVLLVLSVVTGWYFWQRQPPKTLDWSLINASRLIDPDVQPAFDDVIVTRGGKRVLAPTVILLQVGNSSTQTIGESDFINGRAELTFGGIEVLEAKAVSNTDTLNMPFEVINNSASGRGGVILKPKLVNAHSSLRLQLLVDGFPERGTLDSLFAGQTRPSREVDISTFEPTVTNVPRLYFIALALLMANSIGSVVLYYSQGNLHHMTRNNYYELASSLIPGTVAVLIVLRAVRSSDRLHATKYIAGGSIDETI